MSTANPFTEEEIDTLIKALECWKSEGSSGSIVALMLGRLACPSQEAWEEMEPKIKEELEERRGKQSENAETAILLQGKLVRLKREMKTASRLK